MSGKDESRTRTAIPVQHPRGAACSARRILKASICANGGRTKPAAHGELGPGECVLGTLSRWQGDSGQAGQGGRALPVPRSQAAERRFSRRTEARSFHDGVFRERSMRERGTRPRELSRYRRRQCVGGLAHGFDRVGRDVGAAGAGCCGGARRRARGRSGRGCQALSRRRVGQRGTRGARRSRGWAASSWLV